MGDWVTCSKGRWAWLAWQESMWPHTPHAGQLAAACIHIEAMWYSAAVRRCWNIFGAMGKEFPLALMFSS